MTIKIGTRGSKLALWQAYHIQDLLKANGTDSEIITIETKGDKILDKALSKIGSKGVFTQELEEALRNGKIDIAVHSAKDVQSSLNDDLPLIAFTEREQANDVLVSFQNVTLKDNIIVGTSSTRRVALLKHFYPHIKIVDMRGNLQTRFKKMERGDCDAMLLAYAGVHRMEMDHRISQLLDINEFIPPVGQGCVALQASTHLDDNKRKVLRQVVNNENVEKCLLAERTYLRHLEGGCSIPVFGHATLTKDGSISLKGGIVSLDGKKMILNEAQGNEPEILGENLANDVLDAGGNQILKEIKEKLSRG